MIAHRKIGLLTRVYSGSRAHNVLAVAAVVADGETVTIGSDVFEADTNAAITAGRIRVDISAGGTKASQTLTSDNTNVANGDTVTIDTKVYTFKTALTPAEGEVLIGASADASLLNLIRAINHSGTPGTDYQCAAVHPTVTAATSVTSHAFLVTAVYTGTGPNAIATTETSAHLSWGATTLASGANPTGAQFVTALVLAINSGNTQKLKAVAGSTNECVIYTQAAGPFTFACTETLAGSGNAWAAAAMYGGKGQTFPARWQSSRSPNAQEVTDGNMYFAFPFPPTMARIAIRTSAGVIKTWDGVLSITGDVVKLDNSGSTDWAATDTVICEASE